MCLRRLRRSAICKQVSICCRAVTGSHFQEGDKNLIMITSPRGCFLSGDAL